MIKSQAEIRGNTVSNRLNELLKFSGVGIINTVIDFTIFTFLTYALSMNVSSAQAFGYSGGMINSFIMNRNFTFKNEGKGKVGKQFISFIIINLISMGISSLLIGIFVNSMNIGVLYSKILVTLITQTINYIGYKLVVFK